MSPFYFEDMLVTVVLGLLTAVPAMLLGLASYVLSAAAVYVIARRRGLDKLWLAWVPILNVWMLGSLSDQYQYVVKRKNTSRRKWLLALNLLQPLLASGVIAFGAAALVPRGYFGIDWGNAMAAGGFALPLLAVSIAGAVIRFVSLYDVYKSLDPDNAVLFLVLSVFISITESFFLFFNREKDSGMPPRRPEPVFETPRTDAWEEL